MAHTKLPYSAEQLEEISGKFSTPFHLYDEKILNERCSHLTKTFQKFSGFKEFFAVKGTPTPALMKIMHEKHNFGMDCSSLGELLLCEKIGITGKEIMFTSNNTQEKEFVKALQMNANINLDDVSMIDHLLEAIENNSEISGVEFPELLCFRINPGDLKHGNDIIGVPTEAKYGITLEQLVPAYKRAKDLGAKEFGMHTMVASNEINAEYFCETIEILVDQIITLKEELDIDLKFLNIGGGFGVDYNPEDQPLDISIVANHIEKIFQTLDKKGIARPDLYMEHARYITAPTGFLVTRVNSFKDIYRKYVGVDACMADLMRPGIYGSYHQISVPAREGGETEVVDLVGSLCENNDKFAIQRELPKTQRGDLVVIHYAGCHGHAMGFNYNAKLRSPEILLQENGEAKMIRRGETYEDYFATVEDLY